MSFNTNGHIKSKDTEKLPFKKYVLYLFIATFLMTGVTFSKYTTSRGGTIAARVATFGNLDLYEKNSDGTEVKSQNYLIAPGIDIYKNPVVSFTAKNVLEMSAYIFVKVNAQNWVFDNADNSYSLSREVNSATLLNWSIDSDWNFLKSDTSGQIFYRTVSVNEELKLAPVINQSKIIVSKYIYASEYEYLNLSAKSIVFTAFATQTYGFENVQSAWNSVGSK